MATPAPAEVTPPAPSTGNTDMKKLYKAFVSFCNFGASRTAATAKAEMDNTHFTKLCKDCGLLDSIDADILFSKVKTPGDRKIAWTAFKEKMVPALAEKKGISNEEIVAQILSASGPVVSSDIPLSSVAQNTIRGGYSGGAVKGQKKVFQRLSSNNSSMKSTGPVHDLSQITRPSLSKQGTTMAKKTAATRTKTAPLSSSIGKTTATTTLKQSRKKEAQSSKTPSFQVIKKDKPAEPSPQKEGFTVVKGMDVTKGRILTDEMKEQMIKELEQAEREEQENSDHEDAEYRKLWRKTRAEQGLETKGKFDKACVDLRAMVAEDEAVREEEEELNKTNKSV